MTANPLKLLALLMSYALLSSPSVLAEPPEDGFGHHGKWEQKREERIKEMHKKLGLTPEQEKQLDEHRKTHREEAMKLRKEKREKRKALREEFEKPKVDEARVKTLHGEIKELDARLADHHLNGVMEVRRVLTPEQFKKFQELTREGRGRDGGKGRKWKGRGKGHGRAEETPDEEDGKE